MRASVGILYIILHNMGKGRLLTVKKRNENGKARKYYFITKDVCLLLD
ncbi:TPA: hypothetical protein ACG3RW_004125 [Clostridioides difficile]